MYNFLTKKAKKNYSKITSCGVTQNKKFSHQKVLSVIKSSLLKLLTRL